MTTRITHALPPIILVACLFSVSVSHAQFQRGPNVVSPELKDGKVTFRILAPNATKVLLSGSDIPGVTPGVEMKKSEEGVWKRQWMLPQATIVTTSTLMDYQ